MSEITMMEAVSYERRGPAQDVLQFVRLTVPELAPHDVRVRVVTSGINPSDVKSRSGIFGAAMPFPYIVPHSDGAGIVDAVGREVTDVAIGDRVWVFNAQWGRPHGTAAQYVVLPSDLVVRLPNDDMIGAACLGIPAMTAHRAVALCEPKPGQTVLIAGGAGAVGHYAIQFAKAAGMLVFTTISSAAKAQAASHAGADACIDYRSEDLTERVRELTNGRGVDSIIEMDVAANGPTYPAILTAGGTAVVYGSGTVDATLPVTAYFRRDLSLRFFLVYQMSHESRTAAKRDITAMLASGSLKHHIAATFPLAEVAKAHEAVEAGPIAGGNVVLTLDP